MCVRSMCVFKCAEAGGVFVCNDWITWVVCILDVFDSTLQHTATHCNTLQHTATDCVRVWVCVRERKTEREKERKRVCV